MMTEPDVAIVGGGPAGLATVIATARAGLSVVLLEKSSGPPDKACGEGMEAFVAPAGESRVGVAFLWEKDALPGPATIEACLAGTRVCLIACSRWLWRKSSCRSDARRRGAAKGGARRR